MAKYTQNNLEELEAESIYILREVVAEFENPVMLYSVGKDSSVMLRLAQKAFYPGPIPFKLLHVDTTFKFKEMYEFRDNIVKDVGARLEVYTNQEGVDQDANPFDWGTQKCCAVMKTQALLKAINLGEYDAAIGGARRDEEKSRAKERIFSFRDQHGQWDPKRQRPELWNLYNARHNPGESIRVFPISNWTELDVWHYILREQIPIVPLYFAKERPVIERDGMLLFDDDRFKLLPGEEVKMIKCRFRSLGCVPCTGAITSEVDSVEGIIEELVSIRNSERATRTIDHDVEGSMEDKKREGYF